MQVAFATTCKNRTQHLREVLPANLADNSGALFVVLDYGSEDGLRSWIATTPETKAALDSGRLVCYHHADSPRFRMAHAKNMAHRLAIREGADVLVNLDADNATGPGFDGYIQRQFERHGEILLSARMIKGVLPRGIGGRLALTRNAFLKSGGYDEEKFAEWGSDDKDLNLRLRRLGYRDVEIPPFYLHGVTHNDRIRFREYPHLAGKPDDFFAVNNGTVTDAVVNNGAIGCGAVMKNYTEPFNIAPIPTRIFGIGWHKTATTSLYEAFRVLGYESWHWSKIGNLPPAHAAKAIWREMHELGRSPTLERCYALCDFPIPLLFGELDRAYPGSKFILTVRDERSWLEAVCRHFSSAFNPWRAGWTNDPWTDRCHRIAYGRADFEPDTFLARYQKHNAEVVEYFRARPRDLLVMYTDMMPARGWDELCRFLDTSVPDVPYPVANAT